MKKASVFIIITILVSQVILAFITPAYINMFRWGLINLQAEFPLPTHLALLLSHGPGVLIHFIPLLVSVYLAIRIFMKLGQPDYKPVYSLLCMTALAVLQITISIFCIASVLMPFHV